MMNGCVVVLIVVEVLPLLPSEPPQPTNETANAKPSARYRSLNLRSESLLNIP
jgi:hypothetical protein